MVLNIEYDKKCCCGSWLVKDLIHAYNSITHLISRKFRIMKLQQSESNLYFLEVRRPKKVKNFSNKIELDVSSLQKVFCILLVI